MNWFSWRAAAFVVAGWVVAIAVIGLWGRFGPGVGSTDSVDDFVISSFDGRYTLIKSPDGTVSAEITERITADFHREDTHHGILRALPTHYRGYALRPRVTSVTMGDGTEVPWSERSEDGVLTLRIGSPTEYVTGRQAYVIRYTYANVVQDFTGGQEFYWDINGDAWRQPTTEVTATVTVPSDLARHLTTGTVCYRGARGSRDGCEIQRRDAGGTVTFTARATDLPRAATMTVAIGFAPGSFTSPTLSSGAREGRIAALGLLAVQGLLTGLLALLAATRARRWLRGRPLVAEYVVPGDLPPLVASLYYNNPARGIAGELLTAVLAGRIRLVDTPEGIAAERLQPPSPDGSVSQRAVELFFEQNKVGEQRLLKTKPRDSRARDFATGMRKYFRRRKERFRGASPLLWWAVAMGSFMVPVLIAPQLDWAEWPVPLKLTLFAAAVIISGLAWGVVWNWQRLHPSDRDKFAYLEGMRWFIGLAEAERMKVVQGANTAERVGPDDMIKIYDRLLPYAVVFGLERTWAAQMSGRTSQWSLQGLAPESLARFAGDVDRTYRASSVSRAASPSGSNSFSSAVSSGSGGGSGGGSSGGGSAGGGGGGGGGGGW